MILCSVVHPASFFSKMKSKNLQFLYKLHWLSAVVSRYFTQLSMCWCWIPVFILDRLYHMVVCSYNNYYCKWMNNIGLQIDSQAVSHFTTRLNSDVLSDMFSLLHTTHYTLCLSDTFSHLHTTHFVCLCIYTTKHIADSDNPYIQKTQKQWILR